MIYQIIEKESNSGFRLRRCAKRLMYRGVAIMLGTNEAQV